MVEFEQPETPEPRETAPLRWIALGLGLVALYQLSLGIWSDAGLDLRWGAIVCIAITQILLPVLMLRVRHSPVHVALRVAPLPLSQCLWIVLLAACMVLPVEWLAQWNTRWMDVPSWALELQEELRPESAADWILSGLTLCVFAPIGEELLFRGLIQQGARGWVGGGMAAVATGLGFALVHFSPWYFLGLALLGILMGLCFERSGSLLASMLFHAVYNFTTLLLLGYDDLNSLELPAAALGMLAVVAAGIGYVAFGRLRRVLPWEDDDFSDS